MSRPRLLALDMDGTLLDSTKHVRPRTAEALERLAGQGVPLCFCTGRNVAELRPYLPELPFMRYGVLVSGAVVRDLHTQEIVSISPLSLEQALEVIRIGQREDAMAHALAVDESVLTTRDLARLEQVHMEVYRPLYETCATHVRDIVSAVKDHSNDLLKVNLYHTSPEARDRSRARLQHLGLSLADAEDTSVECTAAGVSKAMGLAALCDHVGCTLGETVMVGDAGNDLEALGAVGMPVAMGNATPEVKEAAMMVVSDCDHDGIVEVAERLF